MTAFARQNRRVTAQTLSKLHGRRELVITVRPPHTRAAKLATAGLALVALMTLAVPWFVGATALVRAMLGN